jgi:hypothetical protein
MDEDAARRKHTRAVAYVRWQLASEKYNAMTRALADRAADAEDVKRAAAEVTRRYADWMQFAGQDANGSRGSGRRTEPALTPHRE